MKYIIIALLALIQFAGGQAPETATVKLAWDANSEVDLAGYRLKLGTASGVYTQTIEVPANATQKSITVSKTGYYFAVVTAYNTSGLESEPSKELVFSASGKAPARPGGLRRELGQ